MELGHVLAPARDHRLAPLFVALDWILVTRTVRGNGWRPVVWLTYPVAFLVFSWGRGADGGWPAALTTTSHVLVAFLVIALLVHFAGNWGSAARSRARAAPEVSFGTLQGSLVHRKTPETFPQVPPGSFHVRPQAPDGLFTMDRAARSM